MGPPASEHADATFVTVPEPPPPPPPPPEWDSGTLFREAKALSDSLLSSLEESRVAGIRLAGMVLLALGIEFVILGFFDGGWIGFLSFPLFGLAVIAVSLVYLILPSPVRAFVRRWPWNRWFENPDRKLPLGVSGALRELLRGREAYARMSKELSGRQAAVAIWTLMVVLVGAIAASLLFDKLPFWVALPLVPIVAGVTAASAVFGILRSSPQTQRLSLGPLEVRLANLNRRLYFLEQEFWHRF